MFNRCPSRHLFKEHDARGTGEDSVRAAKRKPRSTTAPIAKLAALQLKMGQTNTDNLQVVSLPWQDSGYNHLLRPQSLEAEN